METGTEEMLGETGLENEDLELGQEGQDNVEGQQQEAEANAEAVDDAIKEAEAVDAKYTEAQFSGLLRDKQAETQARQMAQAELAQAKADAEALKRQLDEAKNASDELSEEEAYEAVTKGELKSLEKNLTKTVADLIKKTREADKMESVKAKQAESAISLQKTHTAATKGEGLDAKTVVDAAWAWLSENDKPMLEAMRNSANVAQRLYDFGVAFVPEIKTRYQTRQNALLAKKLDQSPQTPPGGGGVNASKGDSDDVLLSIMDGSLPDTELEKMIMEGGS